MIAGWLTSGWLDVALVAAWFLVVLVVGAGVWGRGDGE
jgi:hypothetical protein